MAVEVEALDEGEEISEEGVESRVRIKGGGEGAKEVIEVGGRVGG